MLSLFFLISKNNLSSTKIEKISIDLGKLINSNSSNLLIFWNLLIFTIFFLMFFKIPMTRKIFGLEK